MNPEIMYADPEAIIKLAECGNSASDIAYILGIPVSTFHDKYKSLYLEGRAHLKNRILKKQLQKALLEGSVPMLIHLGKTICGQTEKQQIEHSGNAPITIQHYGNGPALPYQETKQKDVSDSSS